MWELVGCTVELAWDMNGAKWPQMLLTPKEWCGHHLLKRRIQRLRVARLRDAACPGASRAWQGRRRAAPVSCGQLHAAAVVQAAVVAELERRWRQQEGALGDEQTEGLQPAVGWRQQDVTKASVCFCAAENCWAKSSTASPNRPAWEIGESRKRCLSDSLIYAKVSHRWRSWTTNVDIVWPRARAVTFVALSARSVAVRSSCNTPGSASPSCSCFNALAWWTCRRAMACRAEAACPAAP